jgi:hypothetical protein
VKWGPGTNPRQPEQAPRVRVEQRVGAVEGHAHGRLRITVHRQMCQAVSRAQFGQVSRDRLPGPARQVRRRDADRQRQASADHRELGRRLGLRRDPPVTQDAREQADRFVGGQHVQRQAARTMRRDQPGQLVTAGHDHQALRASWQQWTHLLGVTRVVQHQHAPARQQRPQQRRGFDRRHRDAVGLYSQRREHLRQRLRRMQRRAGRVAAQVDEQLPIGKPLPHPMRPAHRQRRLADPTRTGDRRQHHRRRRTVATHT